MKLHASARTHLNTFTGYGEGYVEINGQRVTKSVIVTASKSLDWEITSAGELTDAHAATLLALEPEIVLLGSGRSFAFPDPAVLMPLHKARIGVEVMDTKAACRTYNILLAEDRNVVAALIVD